MTKPRQGQQEMDEAAFFQMMRDAIPPKRSFKILRKRQTPDTDRVYITHRRESGEGEYEWITTEAHSYTTVECGALCFNTQEFCEKGQQGPGIYGRVTLMLAPGMWAEVQEITKSMQIRSVS